jgi:hypothetical protein
MEYLEVFRNYSVVKSKLFSCRGFAVTWRERVWIVGAAK